MTPRVWQSTQTNDSAVTALARQLNVSSVTARLLVSRGLTDVDDAQRFLSPSLHHLHDPMLMADMPVAVARIEQAIAVGQRIAVHGDYDVDGVTSTVILRRALELLGANVTHFIPERLRDGYGLQPASIDRLWAEGVGLVISVDCGIRGAEAAVRARELGVDLIITDHHEPDAQLPDACAVVNPKRHDCPYPDKWLAGVGVALKLVQALCQRAGHESWLPGFVKIAAIGTLADVVPLIGENRVIAKLGLEMLSKGPHKVGLRMLLESAGLSGKAVSGYHVGFVIAPRINAAGRMSTPDIAARLLLASDEGMLDEARILAEQLNTENLRRREEEAQIVQQAMALVDRDPGIGARTVLVLGGDNWHRGVVGIVASKLVEAFHRPAIVISIEGGVAHGSCRSIAGFDMLGALESCAGLLTRFGGHRQAAGFSMDANHIADLRQGVNVFADAHLKSDDLQPRLRVDGILDFGDITSTLLGEVERLAPFGPANRRPVFYSTGVEVVHGPRVLKERHLKMAFRQRGRVLRGIAWRAVGREATVTTNRAGLDIAYTVGEESWNGELYVQLTLEDFRAPGQSVIQVGGDSLVSSETNR
jgi:single-stranded-DNA-specific exonuclease